jgi:putative restriction endonuclease
LEQVIGDDRLKVLLDKLSLFCGLSNFFLPRFDLRIGLTPAGLEAARIQWHHVGGPDIEPNGLSLCALHHKLFDVGAFTVEPSEHRVVFSQHAISGGRGMAGELPFHGRAIHPPQHGCLHPNSWRGT